MTNIDKTIEELQLEIAKKNPAYQFKPLSGNHNEDWLKNKANRERKAKELREKNNIDNDAFQRAEIEACRIMLNTPAIMWWIENVLTPLCIPPKDKVQLEVDPQTRRKQIEAYAYDNLLDNILEKGTIKL